MDNWTFIRDSWITSNYCCDIRINFLENIANTYNNLKTCKKQPGFNEQMRFIAGCIKLLKIRLLSIKGAMHPLLLYRLQILGNYCPPLESFFELLSQHKRESHDDSLSPVVHVPSMWMLYIQQVGTIWKKWKLYFQNLISFFKLYFFVSL